MAATSKLSTRSAGVRRLLQEAAELEGDSSSDLVAAPLEEDLFTWHFTIKGPTGGDFEGGIYHGKLVLPPTYPFLPPEVYLLTPSGRFEVNKKICLSISSFHPESWQPSWGIRTALVALMAFFASDPKGAVGSLDAPPAERKRLARCSSTYQCPDCGFDASSPDVFPLPPSTIPSTPDPNAASDTEDGLPIAEDSAPTTIFPSLPPASPHSITAPPTVGSATGGSDPGPGEAGRVEPAPRAPGGGAGVRQRHHHHHHHHPHHHHHRHAPEPAMVLQGAMHTHALPDNYAAGGASFGGGGPLWVDRAILVVLLALLALVVRKLA